MAELRGALPGEAVVRGLTKGAQRYDLNRYGASDAFVFGPETRGLPAELLAQFSPECRIRLPMLADSRSLNLSTQWRWSSMKSGGNWVSEPRSKRR